MVRSEKSKRPTSADVALAAGLSRSTVSYVLNNDPDQRIPMATRQRVIDAASKLGYSPSASARSLRLGRSDLVLCLLPDWPMGSSLGFLLEYLSASLENHELTLLLHPRAHSKRPTSALWRSISPAAVLVFEDLTEEEHTSITAAGAVIVPVFAARSSKSSSAHGSTDGYGEDRLGQLQVEHLADSGHSRIAYGFPDDERLRPFADPRLEGAQRAAAERNLAAPNVQVVPLDPAGAERAVKRWRSARPKVTAVCAYNDEVAMAILAAAERLGVRVPGQLAVIGVDDIPSAQVTQPPLTTVTRDLRAYAETVSTQVMRALRGQPPLRRLPRTNSVTLIRRESA